MNNGQKPPISIIVPAYNEANNIKPTIDNIIEAADDLFSDYEILIIDCVGKDGKDDGTAAIAGELADKNPRIRVVHNPYISLGAKYWQGVNLAKFKYLTWFPGDNETSPETIKNIFQAVGKADIVCSYAANTKVRSWRRRLIAWLYTFFINTAFGLKLKYFNGVSVYKTELLKNLSQKAKENEGYSFSAEILVRLLKNGYNYMEVPQYIVPRKFGKNKSLNLEAFKSVAKRMISLFWELEITH